tara:strand:+ start:3516 stop:4142 length:627 start_codon:yes stop_codon:yes gene_type:complete
MKKPKIFCDIDSTINNHSVRIRKWTLPKYPGNHIHWKAFTEKEIMLDEPIKNAKESILMLSNKYSINFLTARGFNGYRSFRIFPERYYDSIFGYYLMKINNFSSIFFKRILNSRNNEKYAYSITKKWLDKHGFIYDNLFIVDSMKDKISFLKDVECHLFVDDMSWGQNLDSSYINLYTEEINELKRMNINYEIYNENNNWNTIVKKYI